MSYTFKSLPSHWRDWKCWEPVDTSQWPDHERKRFESLSSGIVLYLETGKLRAAARSAKCSRSQLLAQLDRCVALRDNGELLGWAGLIDGLRIAGYHRKKAFPEGEGAATRGASGAFQRLLNDHPEKRATLDKAIDEGVGDRRARTSRTSSLSLYVLFLKLFAEIPVHQYPHNSGDRCRRSVERYAKHRRETESSTTQAWHGSNAVKSERLGTGETSFRFDDQPFDVAGIDEQEMHVVGTVRLPGPAGPQRVPIKRMKIVFYVDYESRAALGYSLAIRTQFQAAHVEQAITFATKPWKPRELRIEGLRYKEGAGFPVGCIDGLVACRPATLRMDNPPQHYARRITQAVKRALGCQISFSPIATWSANAITERVIGMFTQRGMQRMPFATGQGPRDPLRRDAVKVAVDLGVDVEDLIDIADVELANYNGEPQAGLGGRSPLQALRDRIALQPPVMLLRPPAPPSVTTPPLGITVESRPIRGQQRPGKHVQPYIQIDKVRYSGPALKNRYDLLGKTGVVHIDEQRMRTVRAFLPNGESLGELTTLDRGWRRTEHTRDMRKAINALVAEGRLPKDSYDLVREYLSYLVKKTRAEARERPGRVSVSATKLAESSVASNVSIASLGSAGRPSLPPRPPLPRPTHARRPSWE